MTTLEGPAREMELAEVAMGEGRSDDAVAHLSSAIRTYTASGDRRSAAMACAKLGDLFANATENLTAARAWFVRAIRLLEDEPPCIEQGWVALAAMGCDVDDPAVLLERAEFALERARRFGDVNLETKALADAGLAHVQAGRIDQGMALLDEAMALACGPADDVGTTGRSICSFFTACYVAADFDRARSWSDTFRQRGLIGEDAGAPTFLSSHCDSVHAAALCEVGQWAEAEAVLTRAIAYFEERMQMPSWHPEIALAELRICQGRLAEAEMLLLGKDGHLQALLPAARLHLARGDHELARAAALRGLRAIGDDRLRAAELLAVVVEAELASGSVDQAAAACEDLLSRIRDLDVPALQVRAAVSRARVLIAQGDLVGAIAAAEKALDRLPSTGAPLQRATLMLQLARLHETGGNWAAAQVEGRRAAAELAALDVVLSAADRGLLERLGLAVAPLSRRPQAAAVLRRESAGWLAACDNTRVRLPDTKGMRYLAELLANPGVESHALDLVDRVEGVSAEPGIDRRRLGDSGDLLDARARRAYRHRVEELRAEIDEALACGSEAGAESLQAELDQIVAELARAFGLGGRSRSASSVAERARLNVTRALRSATARLTEALPEAGGILNDRLRTGLYCAYEPDPADAVHWTVQSEVNEPLPR